MWSRVLSLNQFVAPLQAKSAVVKAKLAKFGTKSGQGEAPQRVVEPFHSHSLQGSQIFTAMLQQKYKTGPAPTTMPTQSITESL